MDIKNISTEELEAVCEFGFTRIEIDALLHALDCALNEGQLDECLYLFMDVLGLLQKHTRGKK
jgi:hypothetical protein